MGIALIMLMAGFIKICSVHTPSSNPKLPPPKPLPGTEHPVFGNLQYPRMGTVMATERTRLIAGLFWPLQKTTIVVCIFFLRYTEEETTAAGKPAAPGPAALPSAQRELPDGTDEKLRDITSLLLCAFKGSTSLQRFTFNIPQNLIKDLFHRPKPKVFWRPMEPNGLSAWALRLVSSGSHSFPEGRWRKLSALC